MRSPLASKLTSGQSSSSKSRTPATGVAVGTFVMFEQTSSTLYAIIEGGIVAADVAARFGVPKPW